MASTYSPLKIELIGTGDQSGTWGTTTNTNLGTAIEEAITGTADVAFSSADVTLTLTNTNTAQTARNLRLNLTGTVAAAQNLIVPAIEKQYIVNNGLTYDITVKNSSGTGVAVPAGKSMIVFNTGTNVVEVVTSLATGTVIPVANGGTGATTASGARSNLSAAASGANSNITSITGLTTPLAVNQGGTGVATTTAYSVLCGGTTSTGAFQAVSGLGTSGQLLTSNGVGALPSWQAAPISTTITGTANQVLANGTSGSVQSGSVTLTLPQSVATTSNVQFGSLGLGTAASGTSGEIRATNNITAYYSDERLKTKLGNIENALEKVGNLSGFYYHANETAQALGYEVKQEVGVSAQEVQRVMPEVVAPAPIDEQYLTVRYERLVPLLIEAIKELKTEIDNLKAR